MKRLLFLLTFVISTNSHAKSITTYPGMTNLFAYLQTFADMGPNLEAAGYSEAQFSIDTTYDQCRYEYLEGITAEFKSFIQLIEENGNMEGAGNSYPEIKDQAIEEFSEMMSDSRYKVCSRTTESDYSKTKEILIIGDDGYTLLLYTGWEN